VRLVRLQVFFASSLVNYNLGDGEVALVFWWLLGIALSWRQWPVTWRSTAVVS